ALTELGMSLAFSPKADFSGITKAAPLWLSAVIHKAYVKVNEQGTEAAGATAAVVAFSSMTSSPRLVKAFRADHPFFFLSRENRPRSLLAAGRVVTPAASE